VSRLRAARRASRATFEALATLGAARLARGEDARARAARLSEALAEMVAIHDLLVAVRGVFPARPAVIVANHVSYLDPIVLGALVPCAPIAKGEVARWPVIGTAARALGVHFVDRASAHSCACVLRAALRTLEQGVSILNFPEGTTTDGSRLLPFRRGVFGLARLAGVPIVPIALRFASRDLAWTGGDTFLPHYLRTASRRAPAVHVDVGPAIAPDRSADELARITHQRIARMLRDHEDPHGSVVRLRVPAPRPDAVLPAARRDAVA
jgi:1-acyl-sn-glycerol-3-phosphate acyltransferase